MAQRGRKSKAAQEAAEITDNRSKSNPGATIEQRPEPPEHLTNAEANLWRQVVNRMPADWFPEETHELLAQYCRHAINARKFATLKHHYESREPDEIDRDDLEWLLKQHDREGRAMSNLATKMRLTQQSTYSEKHTKPPAGPKPWEA